MIKASDKEWELAESTANEIQCRIQKYFIESVNPKYTQFCKVEVLVPVTENINMEFMIDVPKEMMDEDNSTLLEYFVNHIYKPEDKYMTESINTIIAERDAAALRLEENLKNFDPEAFLRECEEEDIIIKPFGINNDPPCPVNTTMPTDFDGDILEMSIEDEYNPWDEYLPEGVDNEIFFAEMAEIYPKYVEEQRPKIKFRIVVPQGDEGPVPHLHMYFRNKKDKDFRYISFICLHKAEYAPQHEGRRLNSQEKKALIEFLNTFRKGAWTSDKEGNPVPCNCWQECADTWINTHGDKKNLFKRDDNGMIIMPDYSDLPTKGE